ncbi:MAG: PilN domain-containing protein [Pyrinomonadaceae bacterium]|nr:PilN domain-containing protein [Pyrinomonadaceae bacterium]
MIKINLLESITDKPTSTVVVLEKKVSNPASRFYLLLGIVGFIMVAGIVIDYFTATSAQAAAQQELANQQEIAKKYEAISKEQAELEKKIKDTDDRINAIKNLRASQGGPSAVLEAMRERLTNAPGVYLENVEQKGEVLTITGNSKEEYTVTQFGRSLEFSGGLFSNLSIETQRKVAQVTQQSGGDATPPPVSNIPDTITFKITCAYTPSKAANQPSLIVQPQSAQTTNPSGTPTTVAPQVAKK